MIGNMKKLLLILLKELDANQRIKMFQIALQYTLPRLQAMVIKDEAKDLPLFL